MIKHFKLPKFPSQNLHTLQTNAVQCISAQHQNNVDILRRLFINRMFISFPPLFLALARLTAVMVSAHPSFNLDLPSIDGAPKDCHAGDAIIPCGFTVDAGYIYAACTFACWPGLLGKSTSAFDGAECGVCLLCLHQGVSVLLLITMLCVCCRIA